MGLGTITNAAQGARAVIAPQNGARGSTGAETSHKALLDDAAAAVIQIGRRAEEFDVRQNVIDSTPATAPGKMLREFTASFSESLAKYKEISQKVAGGRFSPKTLRDQIEVGAMCMDDPDIATEQDAALAFLNWDESKSASRGATETRALAWLKDKAQRAQLSQRNIEPERVLLLLRGMIRSSAAKPDRQETVASAEEDVSAREADNEQPIRTEASWGPKIVDNSFTMQD